MTHYASRALLLISLACTVSCSSAPPYNPITGERCRIDIDPLPSPEAGENSLTLVETQSDNPARFAVANLGSSQLYVTNPGGVRVGRLKQGHTAILTFQAGSGAQSLAFTSQQLEGVDSTITVFAALGEYDSATPNEPIAIEETDGLTICSFAVRGLTSQFGVESDPKLKKGDLKVKVYKFTEPKANANTLTVLTHEDGDDFVLEMINVGKWNKSLGDPNLATFGQLDMNKIGRVVLTAKGDHRFAVEPTNMNLGTSVPTHFRALGRFDGYGLARPARPFAGPMKHAFIEIGHRGLRTTLMVETER